jgi:hypothetical protein
MVNFSQGQGKAVMGGGRVTVVAGVVMEEIGKEFLVLVPGSRDVIAVSGEAHAAIQSVEAGESVPWSEPVAELVRLGVLTESVSLSRRGLITAGAVGAGVGIMVFAMPGVAAAASQHNAPDAQEVALTFFDRNLTVQDGARYVVRVAVRLPLGFVAPGPDPVPISARIGTDQVPANFITLFGNVRGDWYQTGRDPHLLFWDISTALGNGGGWFDTDGEVAFTWGTTTYRATGPISAALGFG